MNDPEIDKDETVTTEVTSAETREMEEDFAEARKNLKAMLEASSKAIENLTSIAEDSEHPRAFEVLATLLSNTSALSSQLMDLHQRRKNISRKDPVKGSQQALPQGATTNVFIGTSADLQKKLLEKVVEKIPTTPVTDGPVASKP